MYYFMIQLSGHTIVISGYTLRAGLLLLSVLSLARHTRARSAERMSGKWTRGAGSKAAARPAASPKLHAARALKLRLQSVEELVLLLSLTAATRLAARRAATRLAAVARPIVARLRHGRRRLPLRGGSATGPLPLRHPALGVVVVGVALLVEQLLPA